MEEITLSNGTVVHIEPTPFAIGFDLMNKIPELRYPDEPVGTVKTLKGRASETVALSHDSPEWKEYETARREVDEARASFNQYLPWQEGVLEWKLADNEKWQHDVPKGYSMPRMLEQAGGFSPLLDNKRIAYIRYVVCKGMDDVLKLTNALLSGMPITEEEVESAVEGFPGTTPRQEDGETTK